MFLQILPPDNISLVEEIISNKLLLFFIVTIAVMIPFFIKNRRSKSVKTITVKRK
jgi:hypothetical protein